MIIIIIAVVGGIVVMIVLGLVFWLKFGKLMFSSGKAVIQVVPPNHTTINKFDEDKRSFRMNDDDFHFDSGLRNNSPGP